MTTSLQSRRVWIGGGIVAAVLIAAAAWFMLISPELTSADDLHAQTAAQQASNAQLAKTVDELKAKSRKLPTYTAALKSALESLPSDSGLPAFNRQVVALANSTHVEFTGIAVGAAAPLSAAVPATTSAAGSTDSTGAATSGTSGSTTGSSTTGSSTTGSSTAGTATPAAAIYSIPITITSVGPLTHQAAFLEVLRAAGPRYGLVTSALFAPAAGTKEASIDGANLMTTQVTIFSAPQSPTQITQLNKLLSGDIGS
ncbi:MAG: hypothetical protein ACRDVG_08850 [Jatrophihabitantaceae bacterium]